VVSAILLAAGKSQRYGRNKLKEEIFGRPLLYYPIMAFELSPLVDEIILVTSEEIDFIRKEGKLKKIVRGGERRGDSVSNGLKVSEGEKILIHDCARPLVSQELIRKVVKALDDFEAVTPAIRVRDAVKMRKGDFAYGLVKREDLLLIQTPQGFHRELIISTYKEASDKRIYEPDDASLVEKVKKKKAFVVEGEEENIKITYREDLDLIRKLLTGKLRIGFGYDRHKFVPERKLYIGSIEIPFEFGLAGHSDGDVLLHAIIDSLLGPADLGNIGTKFPDSDEQYKEIRSSELLSLTERMIRERGFLVINVDATVVLEEPFLNPYIGEMRKKIAEILRVDTSSVSVKAKRGEGIGIEGKKEGVSAFAVSLLIGIA